MDQQTITHGAPGVAQSNTNNSSSTDLLSADSLKTLQDAIACGIVDLDSVSKTLMATKKERILKMHPYAITAPKDEKGRWQTYYRDNQGKRKIIRTQSEEDLLDKLYDVYQSQMNLDKMTFYKLYEEWIEYKAGLANSQNTIKRNKQHYKKYLSDSVLNDMTLPSIDDLTLEKECNRLVKEYELTSHEWTNVKTIIKGVFEYAMRKHIIFINPLLNVKIHVKFRQVAHKTGRTETYTTDEKQELFDYLEQMYAETSNPTFLTVKLNFYLGLRVGELVALKWKDLLDDKKLHVEREEIRNQETNMVSVVDHTKTHTDRYVAVVKEAHDLFCRIAGIDESEISLHDFCLEHQEDYINLRDGNRLESRQFNYVLEKYAQRTGKKTKSSHKIRKTYASNLNAAGVPLDCIREQLGHTDAATTLKYIFNPFSDEQTYDLLSKALQSS